MMVRILHISLDTAMGGIENFLLNVYQNIDKKKIQFDFIEYGYMERDFDYKFRKLGAKIYNIADRKKNPIRSSRELRDIIKNGKYDIVHIHKNSLADVSALRICKSLHVKNVILHSHNAGRDGKLINCLHKFNKRFFNIKDVYKFACSDKAGQWMFDKKYDYKIINNGIETEKFQFDLEKRNIIRNELNANECFIIGSVGRLTEQKNPLFMLKVLAGIKDQNIKLLWVGDGDLKDEMVRTVRAMGLNDRVILTGRVSNPELYYQAMDLFVMPSLYEGYPIAAVEAQCAGVPVVLSANITREVGLAENVEFVDGFDELVWRDIIYKIMNKENNRAFGNVAILKKRKFDIKDTTKWLEQFYLEKRK